MDGSRVGCAAIQQPGNGSTTAVCDNLGHIRTQEPRSAIGMRTVSAWDTSYVTDILEGDRTWILKLGMPTKSVRVVFAEPGALVDVL